VSDTSVVVESELRPARSPLMRVLLSRDAIFIGVLLAFLVVASLVLPRFASPVTVGYLLLGAVPVLLLALPMTLIIVTGEIDLSVASLVGMTAGLIGTMTLGGAPFPVAVLVGLAAALLGGVLNGVLIAFLGLPSLAVTIGTLALYRGLALVFIGDNSVSSSNFPAEATGFINSKLGATGIPLVIIPVVLVVIAFAVVLHFTPFGRGIFALGYSKEAARFVGIRIAATKFGLYVTSGLVAGLVGVYWVLYYSARSDSATGLELTVIAAVLLGGVSIFGGKGTIPGAIAGVLLIASVNYALRLQRVPDVVLIIITGSLLILSVVAPSSFAAIRHRLHVRRMQRSLPGTGPV
jgi:rhamnose transport system permease protein